ncbi:hypothetical protein AAG906_030557 [Vitis piasezkii]|uniref:AP2/ERF domain-containing protein n=2 Tax=Vitis vinifera TaxID=29760 RepID=A0ABY9DQ88_VITVI|nr:ethylene-responsive transcription factor ERF011 [Vitis vinifera]WKA09919.1 hypothetical protein VitviT2T_027529 [Vitis vinifera]|eukprot:XP_019082291.1 PREDICTED: ethylene-responsive transcription factor ERF011-like [Vitis vinifera]
MRKLQIPFQTHKQREKGDEIGDDGLCRPVLDLSLRKINVAASPLDRIAANFGAVWGTEQRSVVMMEGKCCATTEKRKQRQQQEKPYRGIRMRKWGKWVAEIREPNKRSRIWLGSYSTPKAAARAYDTAVFCLRGRSARLNFPEYIAEEDEVQDLSAASIRKKATEVGARVDAMETALHASEPNSSRVSDKPDLNEYPSPESSDDD